MGVLKVGLEAYVRWGPPAVEIARRHARAIFLDLKLHDIPNTVAGAVRSARELDVDYLTLHAAGGPAMIAAAAEAADGRVALLAVTVLTHLDEATLERLDLPGGSSRRALLWAHLAREAGAAGVVCSPLELAALRAAEPRPFQLVAPGIRPAGRLPAPVPRRSAANRDRGGGDRHRRRPDRHRPAADPGGGSGGRARRAGQRARRQRALGALLGRTRRAASAARSSPR